MSANNLDERVRAWQARVDADGIGLIPDIRAAARDHLKTRAQTMMRQGLSAADVAKKLGVAAEQLAGILPTPSPNPETQKPASPSTSDAENRAARAKFRADIGALQDELRKLGGQ